MFDCRMAAQNLDHFLPGILTQDTKKRIEVGEELVTYLRNGNTSLYCEEMDKLVDGLTAWVSSSNFKVRILSFLFIFVVIMCIVSLV